MSRAVKNKTSNFNSALIFFVCILSHTHTCECTSTDQASRRIYATPLKRKMPASVCRYNCNDNAVQNIYSDWMVFRVRVHIFSTETKRNSICFGIVFDSRSKFILRWQNCRCTFTITYFDGIADDCVVCTGGSLCSIRLHLSRVKMVHLRDVVHEPQPSLLSKCNMHIVACVCVCASARRLPQFTSAKQQEPRSRGEMELGKSWEPTILYAFVIINILQKQQFCHRTRTMEAHRREPIPILVSIHIFFILNEKKNKYIFCAEKEMLSLQ